MVAHTGRMVTGVEEVLAAANSRNHRAFNAAMSGLLDTYKQINL